MKKVFARHVLNITSILLVSTLVFLATAAFAAKREKVLLDTDMVEGFDDGIAMLMLATSPKIDLIGVTTITGNTWQAEGTAYGVRQLEAINMAGKIPIVPGLHETLKTGRIAKIPAERAEMGKNFDDYVGAATRPNPTAWHKVYKKMYGKESKTKTLDMPAEDFIIQQVKKYPNEVTLVVIGPCGNIVKAIKKAPEIVPLVKKIVYMGGAFFVEGNVTPAAEFNWWFDPEAAKQCLRAPWKEQIILPLDACNHISFTDARYKGYINMTKNPIVKDILKRMYDVMEREMIKSHSAFVWDALSAAVTIDPSIIKKEVKLPVDINDTYSLSYGESMAFRGTPPKGAQKARIVLEINNARFWSDLAKTMKALPMPR